MKIVENELSITLLQYSTVYNISRTITVSANATLLSKRYCFWFSLNVYQTFLRESAHCAESPIITKIFVQFQVELIHKGEKRVITTIPHAKHCELIHEENDFVMTMTVLIVLIVLSLPDNP